MGALSVEVSRLVWHPNPNGRNGPSLHFLFFVESPSWPAQYIYAAEVDAAATTGTVPSETPGTKSKTKLGENAAGAGDTKGQQRSVERNHDATDG